MKIQVRLKEQLTVSNRKHEAVMSAIENGANASIQKRLATHREIRRTHLRRQYPVQSVAVHEE
jgi:hypothetical protein